MKNTGLPQSIEAEQGALCSMLIAPHIIAEVTDKINEDYFVSPPHRTIFLVMVEMWRSGANIDLITFTQALRDRQLMALIGGEGTVEKIHSFVLSPANIANYLEILTDKFKARQIIAACSDLSRRAFEEQHDMEAIYSQAQATLLRIAGMAGGRSRALTMRENVTRAFDRLEAIMLGQLSPGLTTGIQGLDKRLGGLHRGEVTAITGDTGGGKTSLAHNILEHVAVDLGKTVQLFSYELPALTVTNRLICAHGKINSEHVRQARMTDAETRAFTAAHDALAAANIFIEDDANTTLPQLQSRARKLKATHDTALIIVDYIQKVPGTGKADRRQVEIAQNSDGIQKLAMELDIPIIVLAQWNKKDGSIREASDIVFDAKTLLKIVRDDSKDIEDEPVDAFRDIVIAKNNNGAIGKVSATFHKHYFRFESK